MARRRKTVLVAPWQLNTKLHSEQVRDLEMVHIVNLDALASGRAGADVMWQTMGGVLTWLRVAEKLGQGVEEMQAQHALMTDVVARWVRTGQVGFANGEYETAREGVLVMDQLAKLVDRATAVAATNWSEIRCRQLQKAATSVAA